MTKGFIDYKSAKIPFVMNNFVLELFSESEKILSQFTKEYNFQNNYIITGHCNQMGSFSRRIVILVERTLGCTCYIKCFTIYMDDTNKQADSICLQSTMLDSVFQYKYIYLDLSRSGFNLAAEQKEIYSIPFSISDASYELKYLIGTDHRLGILTGFEKHGKIIINLQTTEIEECYRITTLLNRFMIFMSSTTDVNFERIDLLKNGIQVAFFYCKYVSEKQYADNDIMFCKFSVEKYSPRILDNLAQELGTKITKSIPLGHITDYCDMHSPQRFIEEISAFEYLFDKLEPEKARNNKITLSDELVFMFNSFPDILLNNRISSEEISKEIKKLRTNIMHGYAYYYDFNSDSKMQFYVYMLAGLIQRMSLKLIGFNDLEISEYSKIIVAL